MNANVCNIYPWKYPELPRLALNLNSPTEFMCEQSQQTHFFCNFCHCVDFHVNAGVTIYNTYHICKWHLHQHIFKVALNICREHSPSGLSSAIRYECQSFFSCLHGYIIPQSFFGWINNSNTDIKTQLIHCRWVSCVCNPWHYLKNNWCSYIGLLAVVKRVGQTQCKLTSDLQMTHAKYWMCVFLGQRLGPLSVLYTTDFNICRNNGDILFETSGRHTIYKDFYSPSIGKFTACILPISPQLKGLNIICFIVSFTLNDLQNEVFCTEGWILMTEHRSLWRNW